MGTAFASLDIASPFLNPQQLAPSHGCCGDSLGSRHTALSRALSSQIRGDNGLAGPSRRAPERPLFALGIPAARASSRNSASEVSPGADASAQRHACVISRATDAAQGSATPAIEPVGEAVRGGASIARALGQSGVTAGERARPYSRLGASERWSEPTSREPHAMALTGGDSSERRHPLPLRSRAQSALSRRSTLRVTHDTRHLLDLADACEQAADPILQSATEMEAVVTAAPGWPGISSAAADRLARGVRLKEAAQHLRQDAHDVELNAWLAHRAAGGDVILIPPAVVVRDNQHAPAPANDRWSWRFAAARLFGRV